MHSIFELMYVKQTSGKKNSTRYWQEKQQTNHATRYNDDHRRISTNTYGELQVDSPDGTLRQDIAYKRRTSSSNGKEALQRGLEKTALARNYMQLPATSSRTIFTLMQPNDNEKDSYNQSKNGNPSKKEAPTTIQG